MQKYKEFIVRAIALIAYEFFGTFGISAMWNVSKVQAALIAATVPAVAILRESAKGFIDDGKLSKTEQDAAIKAGEKASKQK